MVKFQYRDHPCHRMGADFTKKAGDTAFSPCTEAKQYQRGANIFIRQVTILSVSDFRKFDVVGYGRNGLVQDLTALDGKTVSVRKAKSRA